MSYLSRQGCVSAIHCALSISQFQLMKNINRYSLNPFSRDSPWAWGILHKSEWSALSNLLTAPKRSMIYWNNADFPMSKCQRSVLTYLFSLSWHLSKLLCSGKKNITRCSWLVQWTSHNVCSFQDSESRLERAGPTVAPDLLNFWYFLYLWRQNRDVCPCATKCPKGELPLATVNSKKNHSFGKSFP